MIRFFKIGGGMDRPGYDDRPIAGSLLHSIHLHLAELESLLRKININYDDCVYRYYHESNKVYTLVQNATEEIVATLSGLFIVPVNSEFLRIIEEGTGYPVRQGHLFSFGETRRILEAYFHARYFLEMVVMSGRNIDGPYPPSMMYSYWASTLYLYNLR